MALAWHRQATSHYLNQWLYSLLTHVHTSLGLNELKHIFKLPTPNAYNQGPKPETTIESHPKPKVITCEELINEWTLGCQFPRVITQETLFVKISRNTVFWEAIRNMKIVYIRAKRHESENFPLFQMVHWARISLKWKAEDIHSNFPSGILWEIVIPNRLPLHPRVLPEIHQKLQKTHLNNATHPPCNNGKPRGTSALVEALKLSTMYSQNKIIFI